MVILSLSACAWVLRRIIEQHVNPLSGLPQKLHPLLHFLGETTCLRGAQWTIQLMDLMVFGTILQGSKASG